MSELNDLIICSDTNEKEAVHAMKSETDVRLMLQLRGRGVSTYEIARVLAFALILVPSKLTVCWWLFKMSHL